MIDYIIRLIALYRRSVYDIDGQVLNINEKNFRNRHSFCSCAWTKSFFSLLIDTLGSWIVM
mgnify:FL=1